MEKENGKSEKYMELLEKLNSRKITYKEFCSELNEMNLQVPQETVKEMEMYLENHKRRKYTKLSEIRKMNYIETAEYIKKHLENGMTVQDFESEITDWYERGMLTDSDLEYIKSALTDVTEKNN